MHVLYHFLRVTKLFQGQTEISVTPEYKILTTKLKQ
jgi:hypothetical protein